MIGVTAPCSAIALAPALADTLLLQLSIVLHYITELGSPHPDATLWANAWVCEQVQTPLATEGRSASKPAGSGDSSVMEILESTLWNRQLGVMSEEIVAALVSQIFEGVC